MTEPAQTLLILGAGGDLTERLLLPGLGGLLAAGDAPGLALVGSARRDWTDDAWRRRVAESFATAGATGEQVDEVVRTTRFGRADSTAADDLQRLLDACTPPVSIYFALSPAVTARSCEALTEVALTEGTRLVLEKPFGADAAGARDLNELVTRLVPEDRVFRVDHFLGMSTVLNIIGLRFANRMLEPLLTAEHVASVDVVFDEDLGLEGRAGYYDGAGALVDMIQSHLLQVLALLTMNPPATLGPRDVRDGTAELLRATAVWGDDPATFSRRARYTAGAVDGRHLPAYADEDGVDPARGTETFAEVVLAVNNWRWAGVPFRLRSGKAIGNARKEAVVTFKRQPWLPTGLVGADRPDRLRIGLGSGADHLGVELNINGPGDPSVLDRATLSAGFGPGDVPEYGQVLRSVLAGDPTLSVRGDTAVECWRIVEPVIAAWRRDDTPLLEYPAGRDGPEGWPGTGLPEPR